jgi:hypothetical protein
MRKFLKIVGTLIVIVIGAAVGLGMTGTDIDAMTVTGPDAPCPDESCQGDTPAMNQT